MWIFLCNFSINDQLFLCIFAFLCRFFCILCDYAHLQTENSLWAVSLVCPSNCLQFNFLIFKMDLPPENPSIANNMSLTISLHFFNFDGTFQYFNLWKNLLQRAKNHFSLIKLYKKKSVNQKHLDRQTKKDQHVTKIEVLASFSKPLHLAPFPQLRSYFSTLFLILT